LVGWLGFNGILSTQVAAISCLVKVAACCGGRGTGRGNKGAERCRERDAVGVDGVEKGEGVFPPHPTEGLGNVVSSRSRVRGGAPAKNEFGVFYMSRTSWKNNQICFIDNYTGTNK